MALAEHHTVTSQAPIVNSPKAQKVSQFEEPGHARPRLREGRLQRESSLDKRAGSPFVRGRQQL